MFRCYWSVKNPTARYIRVLAVFDTFIAVQLLVKTIVLRQFPENQVLDSVVQSVSFWCASLYLVGPLFLACDRCLMVSFPHNFIQHQAKVKRVKVAVLTVLVLSCMFTNFTRATLERTSLLTKVSIALTSVLLLLQFLGCLGLYVTIVVKIWLADKKMAKHRHVGNK